MSKNKKTQASKYFIPWKVWWRICFTFMLIAYIPCVAISFDSKEAWGAILMSFLGNCFFWLSFHGKNQQLEEGSLEADWLPKPMDAPRQMSFDEEKSPSFFNFTLFSYIGDSAFLLFVVNMFLVYGYCKGLLDINPLDYIFPDKKF